MGPRRRTALIGLVAAAWTVAWALLHPPTPHHANSDLYEQLTVARHLAAGDGFLTDIAYPLSAAFPFAARVPQPLIHRPPGYSLLLTPTILGGVDPVAVLGRVRVLQLLLLAGIAATGLAVQIRAGRPDAGILWLGALLVNPLLDMGARWGQVEIAAGLAVLLLAVSTTGGGARAGLRHGVLAGVLTLLRLELFWLPWVLAAGRRRGGRRWWTAALLAWAVLVAPWLARNARLTGDPVFSLQAYAEQRKGLPGETVSAYLTLEPESFVATARRAPAALAAKTMAGVRHQAARLGRWLPWPLLVLGVAAWRSGRPRRLPRRRLAALCLAILLYAPLSHDPRHLLPLLPLLLLGLCGGAAAVLARLTRNGRARVTATAALLLLATAVWPARLPGWDAARRAAATDAPRVAALAAQARALPPGPLLADDAAVLWLAERVGMIRPADAADEARLRAVVAGMAGARVVAETPSPPARPDLRADRGATPAARGPAAPPR